MFTIVESVALIVVPLNVNPVATTEPVPAGAITMSPLVSDVIVPSANMFKSPMPTAPAIFTAPFNVAVPDAVIAATVVVPLMSQVPFMSMAVAVKSISSVAPSPKTVALIPWMN